MAPRKNPVVKIGNYASEIDTTGMSADDKAGFEGSYQPSLPSTPMNKVEKDFVAGSSGRASAMPAVQKARKANKQPPAKEY